MTLGEVRAYVSGGNEVLLAVNPHVSLDVQRAAVMSGRPLSYRATPLGAGWMGFLLRT